MEASPNTPAPGVDKVKRAEAIIRKNSEMKAEIGPWLTQWQDIADMMMTRKAGIQEKNYTPDVGKESRLFDTTAHEALMTMAGGLMSWTTPANEPWFAFQPIPAMRKSDAGKQWLQDCTERTRELLANTSFYTERHEDLLNHCSFGLSALYYAREGDKLRFESLPVGQFCIEENAFGEVDTLYREMSLNARQAVEMFSEENLSPKIREAYKENKPTCFQFIHAVYPRPERERPKDEISRQATWGKAFASCYVEVAEKMLVKESGYDSFPFAVGRYLRWTALGSRTPYGYGPGFQCLPDVRQVNHMQMVMGALGEKAVRPAMMAPDEMERRISLSPGAINYFSLNVTADRLPRPIPTTTDFQIGLELIKQRQEAIRSAFHYQLFNLFASLERPQMTASEVIARESEKITLITPAFSRLVKEKDSPMLQRLFELCAEAGVYDPPPPELIKEVKGNMATIPTPNVDFTSRLALAVKQLQTMGLDRHMSQMLTVAQFDPSVLDNYNWDNISRDSARNNNVPSSWLREEKAVQQVRAARAQAQQAAQSMALAEQGSKTVKNLGGPEKAAGMMGM